MTATDRLTIEVRVTDPGILAYLKRFEPHEYEARLLEAARIGILAMNAASGALDVRHVEEVFRKTERDLRQELERYFGSDGGRAELLLRKHLDFNQKDSPLSRLADEIRRLLSLDNPCSAVSRLLAELQKLQRQRETAEATPRKGGTFEESVYRVVSDLGRAFGDVPENVSNTPGVLPHCKTGDQLITLAAESGAPDRRIVLECKNKQGYTLQQARDELHRAKENRQAQIGIFVFAKGTEPPGLGEFRILDRDVYCTFDESGPPLYLEAAYRIARACLVVEAASGRAGIDLSAAREALSQARQEAEKLGDLADRAKAAKTAIEEIENGLTRRTANLLKKLAEVGL